MDYEEKRQFEDEIDLMSYVKVFLKRKWLILVVFLIAVITAGAFSFFVTPKIYKIDTFLEVGWEIEKPEQLVEKINNNIYGVRIREGDFLEVRAENPINTNLVRMEMESADSQKAKSILEEMNKIILEDYQEKVRTTKELWGKDIELLESSIEASKKEIERFKVKIIILKEEKKILEDKERALEQLGPYQQLSQQLSGSLFELLDTREKLANKRQEIENHYSKISSLENGIKSLENQIYSLQVQIRDIRPAKVVKSPTIFENPIKPRPALNIVIAAILGLFIGIFLAFGKEWWEKSKG